MFEGYGQETSVQVGFCFQIKCCRCFDDSDELEQRLGTDWRSQQSSDELHCDRVFWDVFSAFLPGLPLVDFSYDAYTSFPKQFLVVLLANG